MATRTPFDRSLAFTSLLSFPEFGALTVQEGGEVITQVVEAWQQSDETDMHAFVQRWWAEHQVQTPKEQ